MFLHAGSECAFLARREVAGLRRGFGPSRGGGRDGFAGADGGFSRDRCGAGRCSGDDRTRQGRHADRRPGRQGGCREPRARSGGAHASGLSMPPKRVTVNLAPADLPKEGSHYDLPIALGLMAASRAPFPATCSTSYVVLGELALDGTIAPCRRRAARGDRRQCHGPRADLPAGVRAGSRLGGRPTSTSWRRAA